MLGILRRHVIRQRFLRLVATYDRRIEEARAKHQPVRHIEAEKRAFIHQALASSCGEQPARAGRSSR